MKNLFSRWSLLPLFLAAHAFGMQIELKNVRAAEEVMDILSPRFTNLFRRAKPVTDLRMAIYFGKCGNAACEYQTPAFGYVVEGITPGQTFSPKPQFVGGRWNNQYAVLDRSSSSSTDERWKLSIEYIEYIKEPRGKFLRRDELVVDLAALPDGGPAPFILGRGKSQTFVTLEITR